MDGRVKLSVKSRNEPALGCCSFLGSLPAVPVLALEHSLLDMLAVHAVIDRCVT